MVRLELRAKQYINENVYFILTTVNYATPCYKINELGFIVLNNVHSLSKVICGTDIRRFDLMP